MKKVVFIIPFLSSGGAEKVVSIWSSEIAKLDADVHILVFYRVDNEYSINSKVQIHELRKQKGQYDKLSRFNKILLLRTKLKEINADIAIPFLFHVGLLTTMASIGLNIKIVETIRIDPRYSPKTSSMKFLRNLSVMLADYCIVQNQDQKSYFPKWVQKKIRIFPNPISNEFAINQKKYDKNIIKNIISVGRLEPQKNYSMLINAFCHVANYNESIELKIYGEGSQIIELKNLISERGLSTRIKICGRTTDVKKALLKSDLFILSSNAEGMPNSLMEAMSLGLPCIATDCPTGPSELITNGVNGHLIQVDNEGELVNSLNYMIKNPCKAIIMGEKARKTILNNYLAEKSAKILLNFLDSV